jgi:hypothetical protein
MAWFIAAFNKEPAMVLSACIAVGAAALPYVLVPIRKSMGLPTYQWDADPETHPVRSIVSYYLSVVYHTI